MKKGIIIFFLFILAVIISNSQDVLILMNGDSLKVKKFSKSIDGTYTFEIINKKGKIKKKTFFPSELYSIKKQNGDEIVFFEGIENKYLGFDLTIENVKYYIQGEAFAKENYKFFLGKILNFVLGLGSPYISTYLIGNIIFSPLLPLVVSTILGYTGPSSTKFDKKFSRRNFNKYFKEGFLVAGRVKRINKGIKFAFIGYLIGISSYVILIKTL